MLEFDSKLYLLTVSGSFVRLRLLYLVRNRLLQFVSHFINVFTLSSSLPLYSFQGSLCRLADDLYRIPNDPHSVNHSRTSDIITVFHDQGDFLSQNQKETAPNENTRAAGCARWLNGDGASDNAPSCCLGSVPADRRTTVGIEARRVQWCRPGRQ